MQLLPARKVTEKWEDIKNYNLVADDKGNVLTIHFNHRKPLTIGQSTMFETAENFTTFYNTFEHYIKQYNLTHAGTEAAIRPSGNFYSKTWAKVLAVILLLALIAFGYLGALYGEPTPFFWLKYIAFLLPACFFIYRALVVRK
jgi:hypothetical protein